MSILSGAHTVAAVCGQIRTGEAVLVVTDTLSRASADLIAEAATKLGADVTCMSMAPRQYDGQEPTADIAAAMLGADVILMPVAKSLAHADATRKALQAGARVLSLTATSNELLASDAYRADFVGRRPVCARVAELLSRAKDVTVATAAGTDFTTSADGRQGQGHSGVVDQPGTFSSAPNIEASFSPVERSTEGVFVADASIPYFGIGRVDQPIRFEIAEGRVVKIEGGLAAKKIASLLESQHDPNAYNIAQLAIGLNPEVKTPVGHLGCNYDEGAFGTAHVGIGTSSNLGGSVKASTHFDALMTKPTITLDGKPILENGELCLD